jgi:hypothetical protein
MKRFLEMVEVNNCLRSPDFPDSSQAIELANTLIAKGIKPAFREISERL